MSKHKLVGQERKYGNTIPPTTMSRIKVIDRGAKLSSFLSSINEHCFGKMEEFLNKYKLEYQESRLIFKNQAWCLYQDIYVLFCWKKNQQALIQDRKEIQKLLLQLSHYTKRTISAILTRQRKNLMKLSSEEIEESMERLHCLDHLTFKQNKLSTFKTFAEQQSDHLSDFHSRITLSKRSNSKSLSPSQLYRSLGPRIDRNYNSDAEWTKKVIQSSNNLFEEEHETGSEFLRNGFGDYSDLFEYGFTQEHNIFLYYNQKTEQILCVNINNLGKNVMRNNQLAWLKQPIKDDFSDIESSQIVVLNLESPIEQLTKVTELSENAQQLSEFQKKQSTYEHAPQTQSSVNTLQLAELRLKAENNINKLRKLTNLNSQVLRAVADADFFVSNIDKMKFEDRQPNTQLSLSQISASESKIKHQEQNDSNQHCLQQNNSLNCTQNLALQVKNLQELKNDIKLNTTKESRDQKLFDLEEPKTEDQIYQQQVHSDRRSKAKWSFEEDQLLLTDFLQTEKQKRIKNFRELLTTKSQQQIIHRCEFRQVRLNILQLQQAQFDTLKVEENQSI